MNHLGEQVDSSAELTPVVRAVTGRWREVTTSIWKGSWAVRPAAQRARLEMEGVL